LEPLRKAGEIYTLVYSLLNRVESKIKRERSSEELWGFTNHLSSTV
jgi:hypothetical protein